MNVKKQIEKIHRTTCEPELKKASHINGTETESKLNDILEKCQCIQIASMINYLKR